MQISFFDGNQQFKIDKPIEIKKYRNVKMRELPNEQIQESNELLQKMLEPYVDVLKKKIALLKENKNEVS